MNHLLIVFFCFFSYSFWFSIYQDPKIDSLLTAISQSEDDFQKSNALYRIALVYYDSGSTEVLSYVDKIIELAQNSKDTKMRNNLCKAYYLRGLVFSKSGRFVEALETLDELKRISTELNMKNFQALALVLTGGIYQNKGQPLKSLEAYQNAALLYRELEDKANEAYALSGLATHYLYMMTNQESENDQDSALLKLNQVLVISRELNNDDLEANTLSKIGTVFQLVGNFPAAKEKYLASLSKYRKIKRPYGIAEMNGMLGSLNYSSKQYDSALYYLERAILISSENNLNQLKVKYEVEEARVLIATKDFQKALKVLNRAIEIATREKLFAQLKSAYELKTRSYQLLGDFESAFAALELYIAAKDTISLESQRDKIATLQFEYQLASVNEKIDYLRNQNTQIARTKMAIIVGSILVGILLSMIILLLIRRTRRNRQMYRTLEELHSVMKQNHNLELELKNKELTAQALNIVQKENMMRELTDSLKKIRDTSESPGPINLIIRQIDFGKNKEKDWEEFRHYFEKVHNRFFEKLNEQIGDLSPSEIRLAALLRLNLSTKQCADILGISAESTKMARYRLRKKLQLPTEDNLVGYLMSL